MRDMHQKAQVGCIIKKSVKVREGGYLWWYIPISNERVKIKFF